MKNTKILSAAILVSFTLSQTLQAQQNIPDAINFAPYKKTYDSAKSVSDQKRREADKAQGVLLESQKRLNSVNDQITSKTHLVNTNNQEANQLALNNQSLENQIRTNEAQINVDVPALQNIDAQAKVYADQINEMNRDLNTADRDMEIAQRDYAPVKRENDQHEDRLDRAEKDLEQKRKAVRENKGDIRKQEDEKADQNKKIVELTRDREKQEKEIENANAQIEPAKKLVQDLTPKVKDKADELAAAKAKQKSAQEKMDADQKALDLLKGQNAPLIAKISQLETSIASYQQSLTQQQALYATTQNEISNANSLIQTQKDKQADLNARQNTEEQKRDAAQADATRITAERDANQVKLNEMNAKLRTYTRAQQGLPEVIELQKNIKEMTATIASQNEQITAANNRVAATKAELTKIAADLVKVNAEISRLQALINNGPSTLSAIQSKIDELKKKIAPLATELAEAKQKLAEISPQLAAAQAKLDQSKAAFDTAKSEASSAQTSYDSLNSQLQAAQQKLTRAQESLAQNQKALEKTKADIKIALDKIEVADKKIVELKKLTATLEGQENRSEESYKKTLEATRASRARLKVVTDRIDAINKYIQDTVRARDIASFRFKELDDAGSVIDRRIVAARNQNANNETAIKNNQTRIQDLNDDTITLQADLKVLIKSQAGLQDQVADDRDAFTKLDQVALTAETHTAAKYEDYISRKNEYDRQYADAVEAGRSEGEAQGKEEGEIKGRKFGEEQGNKEGAIAGEKIGRAEAVKKGETAGEFEGLTKGQSDGLAHASASDQGHAEYTRGFKKGEADGKALALSEAQSIDLPRGKQARFEELTKIAPAQTVQIDQEVKKPAPIASKSGLQSMKLSFNFDPKQIACNQTYSVFKKACDEAYKVAKAQAAEAGFERGKNETYEPTKVAATENARLKFTDNAADIKKGYDSKYPNAYKAGVSQGKDSAYKLGVNEGNAAGYKAVRTTAGQEAYDAGALEESKHFSENSVTLVKGARFKRVGLDGSQGGVVGASDLLKLELNVANYGAKPSSPTAVKVEAKALTAGITIRQTSNALASIPAVTSATVSNVLTAQVLENATAGSQERISVRYTDERGKSVTNEITIDVKANLKVSFSGLDYTASPKVGRNYSLTATVNNDGNISSSEKVTLGLMTAVGADVLRLDDSEVEVKNGLRVGASIKIKKSLSYTVLNDAALRSGITLTLYLKHGGRIVAKQDLQLKK